MAFFLLNFTRIPRFFCDLGVTLFDIPKEVVLAEILVLSSIFDFPVVNWAPKWTRTVNFGCTTFQPKLNNLKDSSNIVFVLLEDYLWSKFQLDRTIFGRVRAQNLQKETISWILNQYEKYFKYKLHNRKCYTDETCHRYIS